mgnify:CR=1 FL=1
MKILVYGLSLIMIIGCKKENPVSENSTQKEIVKIEAGSEKASEFSDDLNLQTFGFPAEVDGCSCYFSKNKEDFENEKYIYIDDYGKTAYLKMDNKLHKIVMKNDDFDPENFQKEIKNEDLSIKISGKKVKELEEVMMFEGSMVLTLKNGKKSTVPIYGECGC